MAVVGTVAILSGNVVATHADGTRSVLGVGSPVLDGDVIETGSGSAVSIRFLDDTSLAMDEGARMAIDSLVFDPATASGSAAFRLLEGLFVVVAGDIAASGPDALMLSTPVATIGIRGTSLGILAGAEGTRNLVVLLADPTDGELGKAVVSNPGGTQVLDEVDEATTITSNTIEPSVPFLLSRHQLEDLFGGAILASPFQGRLFQELERTDTAPASQPAEDELRDGAAPATPAEGDGSPAAATAPEQAPVGYVKVTSLDLVGTPSDSFSSGLGAVPGWSDTIAAGLTGGADTSGTTTSSTTEEPTSVVDDGDGRSDDSGGGGDAGGVGGGGVVDNTIVGDPGGDSLVGTAGRDSLVGGPGFDTLEGREGDDVLEGGDGRDLLVGEAGADTLLGGAAEDSLVGGPGNDLIDGGAGIDTAIYGDATGPVRVSLSIAGPQAVGGGLGSDDLRGIEQLSGGPFNDTLTGDGGANNLQGREGNDRLVGGGADDELFGDEGQDRLFGGAGTDFLVGGPDGDDVTGGADPDAFAFGVPGDGAEVTANVTAAAFGLTAGVEYDRLLDFSTAQGDLVLLEASAFGLPQGPFLVAGFNFSQISVPYNGINAQNNGPNTEFAAGRPSVVFSTADSTLYFDPDGAAPGYTVLAEANVTLDATDIRTF